MDGPLHRILHRTRILWLDSMCLCLRSSWSLEDFLFRAAFVRIDYFFCLCDFNTTGDSYRGTAAGCLFFSFFIHIIISMFYHLLSVTCCGMSSRLINKRRYTDSDWKLRIALECSCFFNQSMVEA